MSSKELKADNLLLQAKLDDALAEIKELTNLVEHMEKEKYNGIEIVAQPYETGLFRIDQININYLHTGAVEWLKKSAQLGNSRAIYNVGNCYEKGDGVAKDLTKAREWYTKAAAKVMNMHKQVLKLLRRR